MDKKVISCAFNIDTACVEVRYTDGSMISIDGTFSHAKGISTHAFKGRTGGR